MSAPLGWQRLMLQKPSGEGGPDAAGGRADSWTDIAYVSCNVRGKTGREAVRDRAQSVSEATHDITLRWHKSRSIEPSWRFRGRDYYFEIVSVIDVDFRQRYVQVQARIGYDQAGRV